MGPQMSQWTRSKGSRMEWSIVDDTSTESVCPTRMIHTYSRAKKYQVKPLLILINWGGLANGATKQTKF